MKLPKSIKWLIYYGVSFFPAIGIAFLLSYLGLGFIGKRLLILMQYIIVLLVLFAIFEIFKQAYYSQSQKANKISTIYEAKQYNPDTITASNHIFANNQTEEIKTCISKWDTSQETRNSHNEKECFHIKRIISLLIKYVNRNRGEPYIKAPQTILSRESISHWMKTLRM